MIRSNCRDWCPRCRFGEGSNGRRANGWSGASRQDSYIVRLRSFYALEIRKSTQTGQVSHTNRSTSARAGWNPVTRCCGRRTVCGLPPVVPSGDRRMWCGASRDRGDRVAGVRCRHGAVVIGADVGRPFGPDALRVRRRPRITSHSPSRSSPMKVKVAVSVQWPGESTVPKVSTT